MCPAVPTITEKEVSGVGDRVPGTRRLSGVWCRVPGERCRVSDVWGWVLDATWLSADAPLVSGKEREILDFWGLFEATFPLDAV